MKCAKGCGVDVVVPETHVCGSGLEIVSQLPAELRAILGRDDVEIEYVHRPHPNLILLEAFISALGAMSPAQRQMTMEELENRVCLFCGASDPDCPCWLEEVAEVPS